MTTTPPPKPKGPVPKGRWKNAEDIIEAIGFVTRKIARYRIAAEELNAKFLRAKREGKTSLLWKDADRKMEKADRLEAGYLQRLKRKLATMNTATLPMQDNTDKSIPK